MQSSKPPTKSPSGQPYKQAMVIDSTLPWLGNTLDQVKNGVRFHDWITEVCQAANGRPWLMTTVGRPSVIVVSTPEAYEDVTKTQFDNFIKGEYVRDVLKDVFGLGIFSLDGAQWAYHRKLTSNVFTKRSMRDSMTATIQKHCHSLCSAFQRAADEKRELDLFRVLSQFTTEAFCEIAFGIDMDYLNSDREHPLQQALDGAQRAITFRLFSPTWLWKLQRKFGLGLEGHLQECMKTLDAIVLEIINKSIEHHAQRNSDDEPAKTDLISLFLSHANDVDGEDKEIFTPDALKYMAMQFLLAGRETTAQTLSWFFWMLHQHPEVEAKIREEIKTLAPELFESNKDVSPSMATVQQFTYLEASLKETLRLYPVAPFNARDAAEDTTLSDGTLVPAGYRVGLPNYAIGRLTSIWGPDAEDFNPSRWIDPDTGKLAAVSAYKFVAFHAGPRICLGMNLAMLEMKIAVAQIFSRFHIDVLPGQNITYATSITLPMNAPLKANEEGEKLMEPKSGKLHKLGHGLFGSKWTEKWVHLDGNMLKYFPIATDQPAFSLSSSRQSATIDLTDYAFALGDETRTAKAQTESNLSPVIVEKLRRAEEAFVLQEARMCGNTEYPSNQQAVLEPTSSSLPPSKRQLQETRDTGKHIDSPQSHEGDLDDDKVVPDWNKEYATILGREREEACSSELDVIAHGLKVSVFLKTFRQAAESVVHDILTELPLAPDDKHVPELSLAPNELFGWRNSDPNLQSMLAATVRKFWHQGVLVYLIQTDDTEPSGTNRAALVHSVIAHKLFGHQMRAARAMHDTIHWNAGEFDALWVPLQCTVDYLGFRALVVAAKSSDMSANGTRDVVSTPYSPQEQQHVWRQLTSAFNALGLTTESLAQVPLGSNFGHVGCEPRPSFLPTSATFAAQKGNERVALRVFQNVAGVFPPDLLSEADPTGVASLLFKFRPEFVKIYGDLLPLHSNAHAANHEPGDDTSAVPRRHQQLEVQLLQHTAFSASEHLQRVVIPAFVLKMEEQHQVCSGVHMTDTRSLATALHREGINVRYLGHSFALSSVKHVRQLFLTEMIARVCKSELRAALRAIIQDHTLVRQAKEATGPAGGGGVDEEDSDNATDPQRSEAELTGQEGACDVVVAFFNLVFGTCSTESKLFRRDRVLPHVRLKFFPGFAGGASDALPTLEVILSDEPLLHLPQLFHALQSHVHCAFDGHLQCHFKTPEPFALDDLLPHPLMPPITSLVACTAVHVEAMLDDIDVLIASEQLQDALTRVKCNLAIFDAAPHDERALSACHLLTCAAELSCRMGRYEDAAHFAQLAIENGTKNHAQSAKAHLVLMKVTYHLNKSDGPMQELQLQYAQALEIAQWHLGASHPFLFDIYMSMSEILSDTGNGEEALKVLQCCVTLVRDCCGRSSVVYADLRQQQGQLLYETTGGAPDEAVGVLEDAVGVYEKHFCQDRSVNEEKESILHSCKESATTCCALIATIIFAGDDEANANGQQRSTIEEAYSMALRALSLRKDVLAAEHTDIMHSHLQLGAIAKALGDSFRAIEYFKAASTALKERPTDNGGSDGDHVVRVREVMQTMLLLHLSALPSEKRSVIEKTRTRFALQFARFQASSLSLPFTIETQDAESRSNIDNHEDGNNASETELLAFVVRRLLAADDAIVYFDQLIEQTDRELQEYRKQCTVALTGSGWLSPTASSQHHHNLHSPTVYASRFASFSSGHATPMASVQDGWRSPAADRTSPFRRSSDGCNAIVSPVTGEFTFDGQLAAIHNDAAQAPAAAAKDPRAVVLLYSKAYFDALRLLPVHRDRERMTLALVHALGLHARLQLLAPTPATRAQLEAFHSSEYVAALANPPADEDGDEALLQTFGLVDDSYVFPRLFEYCCSIAGASLTAADALVHLMRSRERDSTTKQPVVINLGGGRHHAMRGNASGFCYVNDVVLAIQRLQTKAKGSSILCVDMGVHHGDGVQEAFYHSDSVTMISFHQFEPGFFPHTGASSEIGSGRGKYRTINVPLRRGITDGAYTTLFERVVSHAVCKLKPDALVLVCGVDTLARYGPEFRMTTQPVRHRPDQNSVESLGAIATAALETIDKAAEAHATRLHTGKRKR
ncbi:Tetratricopeptide-like helical, partial [Globisporangium splendens]